MLYSTNLHSFSTYSVAHSDADCNTYQIANSRFWW
jgi:hypothetical protein